MNKSISLSRRALGIIVFGTIFMQISAFPQEADEALLNPKKAVFNKKGLSKESAQKSLVKRANGGGNGKGEPLEYFKYEQSMDLGFDEYVVDGGTVVIRHKIMVDGSSSGEAPIVSWDDLILGMGIDDSTIRMVVWDDEALDWIDTEYVASGNSTKSWLFLDIARSQKNSKVRDFVFLNGNLIASIEHKSYDELSGFYRVYNNSFATVSMTPGFQSGEYPEFVVRALLAIGVREEELDEIIDPGKAVGLHKIEKPEKSAEDWKRKTKGGAHKLLPKIFPGDLSMSQHAWFMTQTVNREYFRNTANVDITKVPYIEETLIGLGGDILPTLESRNWKRPWNYSDWADNYIEKLYGYLVPEESGEYVFWVAGDEQGLFSLSGTADASGLETLAYFGVPTGRYKWFEVMEQKSEPVYLEQGHVYYYEAWHVESAGEDSFSVAWQNISINDPNEPELIPSMFLSSYRGGIPGTYPRSFALSDLSLRRGRSALMEANLTGPFPMSLSATDELRGDADIDLADFEDYYDFDMEEYVYTDKYHPYQNFGNGLGWIYTDDYDWPYMYTESIDVDYTDGTYNPQVFYDYTAGAWLEYHHSSAPHLRYPNALPDQAATPSPTSGSSNQAVTVDLDWADAANADSYDVYFGTDSTPDAGELLGNVTISAYDPGTLANSTTYYWRVDAKNASGTTTGSIWNFTTVAGSGPPPPPPVGSTIASAPEKWDFEVGMTDWTNLSGSYWQRDAGGTPSSNTGPNHDNTLNTSSGYYMYVEATSAQTNIANKLEGPWVQVPAVGSKLTFFYHMYGAAIGELKVLLKHTDDSVDEVLIATGQQHISSSVAFTRVDVDLSTYAVTDEYLQITFQGKDGSSYTGDMAIDDVMVYEIGADTDGDGTSDVDEMINGTDPLVSDSSGGYDAPNYIPDLAPPDKPGTPYEFTPRTLRSSPSTTGTIKPFQVTNTNRS